MSIEQADRRAGRASFEHARQDAHLVGLLALAGVPRSAGAPPLQLRLDVLLRQLQPRRAAVDDAAERRPVAFAEGRDGEELAEGVAGHAADSSCSARQQKHPAAAALEFQPDERHLRKASSSAASELPTSTIRMPCGSQMRGRSAQNPAHDVQAVAAAVQTRSQARAGIPAGSSAISASPTYGGFDTITS